MIIALAALLASTAPRSAIVDPPSPPVIFLQDGTIDPEERRKLEGWAAIVPRYEPDTSIVLLGYTDRVDGQADTFERGCRYTRLVRLALIRLGVDPERIQSISFGDARPLFAPADNLSERFNRRVEVGLSRMERLHEQVDGAKRCGSP